MPINQIQVNETAYDDCRAELERRSDGQTVLMRDGKVVGLFADPNDAYLTGCERWGLGGFLMKKVGQRPIELGLGVFASTPSGGQLLRRTQMVETRILTDVVCAVPLDGPEQIFSALVATGAPVTSITRRVVETLGVKPVGTVPVVYANGDSSLFNQCWLYVGFPEAPEEDRHGASVVQMGLRPGDYDVNLGMGDYDVVLGMDVLGRYRITISHGLLTVG